MKLFQQPTNKLQTPIINYMSVLVFKTNIVNSKHVKNVCSHIQSIDGVSKWNIDLHDIDKVLRVETIDLTPEAIANVVQMAGYYCVELD